MGVEEIIIDEHINREFKTLAAIRKAVGCNLELILNNICLWQCPYNYEHVNHDGHASREGEEELLLSPVSRLSVPLQKIDGPRGAPEITLDQARGCCPYEELGYEHFKITERFKRTPLLLEHVRAYENRRYDGNLLDLFTLPRKGAFTPVHLEYFIKPEHVNIMKVSELGKVFDLEVRELIQIDNRKLDGFIEHFKNKDCNQTSCSQCRYCENLFRRVAVVNSQEVKRAAQRVRDFSEKLLSGEIFEIPTSHLIFRIPLVKPLLKYLVKLQLRKEQKTHRQEG